MTAEEEFTWNLRTHQDNQGSTAKNLRKKYNTPLFTPAVAATAIPNCRTPSGTPSWAACGNPPMQLKAARSIGKAMDIIRKTESLEETPEHLMEPEKQEPAPPQREQLFTEPEQTRRRNDRRREEK